MAWFDFLRWGRKSGGTVDILRELAARYRSKSGKTINVETAIAVSTVFACARVIGSGMAQVPLKLMREAPDGKSRIPARDHPIYSLLAAKPNPWQTGYEFREMLSWHLELCGRAYVFVNRSVTGRILELLPFEPGAVTVTRADDRTLTYTVRAQNGKTQDFPEASIWHLRGPSWNGWEGLDVLRAAREAIGLTMVTEESQSAMHREGVRPSGLYSVDGKLSPDQYQKLRDWIDREHAGAAGTGKSMILDGAAKWMSTQMSGVDAQHIETRKHQIEEVCRFFGVMPIMVGYADKTATFASAEAMFLAHVVHCLSPRWTRFEQSADAYLLTEKERAAGLYFDFVEEGMIRGSVKDTKDALLGYVNGGLITPNEGRAKLDMNPDNDPASDKLRIPVNVAQEPKPGSDAIDEPSDEAKAIADLRMEVRALAQKDRPINVDARTSVAAAPSAPASQLNVVIPESMRHELQQRVKVDVPGIVDLAAEIKRSTDQSATASAALAMSVNELKRIAAADRVPVFDEKGNPIRSRVDLGAQE